MKSFKNLFYFFKSSRRTKTRRTKTRRTKTRRTKNKKRVSKRSYFMKGG